ncbi:hypothetical protein [Herbiconiux sp. A18JL235]|uniref:WXG100 family type VII secretion target n=1 Tax=Herbiconiux sp. A18JL235 TaxID=3152363 RepID=A0AB39BJC7_9MICO
MADLLVDTGMLQELDSALKLIVDTLDAAGGMSRSTAHACGDGELAGVLIDFADDWEDTREDMLEAVRSISDAVHLVSDGFDKLDSELVRTLAGLANG